MEPILNHAFVSQAQKIKNLGIKMIFKIRGFTTIAATVICLSTSIFTSFPVFSETAEKKLSDLSKAECTTRAVINELLNQSIEKEVKLLDSSAKEIVVLRELLKKIKNPSSKKSVGEQLSVNDREKFSEASQRMGIINALMIVESNYKRDLIAIEKLFKVVDNNYNLDITPDPKGTDAIYAELLYTWQNIIKNEIKTEDEVFKGCTLDFAIRQKEIYLILETSKYSSKFEKALTRVMQLKQKYNMKEFDYQKLNFEDKKEIEKLRNDILPTQRKYSQIQDLMNIEHFAKICKLVYDTSLNDILYSGGNYETIGSSIDELIKVHNLSKEDIIMLNSWMILNEKVPSQATNDFKQITKKFKLPMNKS